MNVFQACSDTSDVIPFSASHSLYLKPVARVTVSVQLPGLKQPGKSISNWEVMEKLRHYAMPEEFINLKVSKSTLEVVRFEGEIENCSKIPAVLARLDGRSIKLSGFPDSLKVRAAVGKPDFPNRHSWDSYFRDAKNMNEMKPGERPDTMYIANLPCKWFSTKSDVSKPSEYILRKVFEAYGEIRCVDIPMLDPFRSQMKSHISGIKMFSNNQNMIFEAYIQFKEYVCFVKIMDSLRGMKLLHKDPDGKSFCASIKVDFDKTKHMSESSIRRRRIEREKLMAKEREREDQQRLAREEEERKLAEERKRVEAEREAALERRRQREERRKAKRLERLKQEEADEMNRKIETEERLLLRAQRRLESFRLLGELFNRLQIAKEMNRDKYKNPDTYRKHRDRNKNQDVDQLPEKLEMKEKELRDKLVKKFKQSDQSDKPKERRVTEGDEAEFPSDEYQYIMDERSYGRGMQRGARGNWSRRRRGNMPFRGNQSFRGNQFPQMNFPPFYNRGGYFPNRGGFPRWPAFPPRGRGGMETGFFPPPFIDPFYLDSAMSDPYYKYFRNITLGSKRSQKCRSRSLSRSRSYSRSYSKSKSRSYSRSRSQSRSSSSHSRSRRSRSNSRGRRRTRTRSRSKSRSRRRSRSRSERRKNCRDKSNSPKHSKTDKSKEKNVENLVISHEDVKGTKASSVHTWSRSNSRERSLSWEKQKDEALSIKLHKHKKEKKKKEKKEKRKRKKTDNK